MGKVVGHITAPVAGRIAIGLFPSAVPQGRPVACCLVTEPGPYQISGVPYGRYFVLAAALEANGRLSQEAELRGAGAQPVELSDRMNVAHVDVHLRPRDVVDPPIVLSLPSLLVVGIRARLGPPVKAGLVAKHFVER